VQNTFLFISLLHLEGMNQIYYILAYLLLLCIHMSCVQLAQILMALHLNNQLVQTHLNKKLPSNFWLRLGCTVVFTIVPPSVQTLFQGVPLTW